MPALRRLVSIPILILFVSLWLAGCRRSEAPAPVPAPPAPVGSPAPAVAPLRVSAIDLGKSVDADKKVTQPTSTFAPSDTIYASVATAGSSASTTLVARWTYQDGQLVNEETQTIAPTGPAVTEFHLSKPDGFPAGSYQVEVIANGASAGKRAFQVQ